MRYVLLLFPINVKRHYPVISTMMLIICLRYLMLNCIYLTVHLPYFEDTQTCTSVCQPTSTTVPVNERAESAIHAYGGA